MANNNDNQQLSQKIQDIINWVKSDIAIEENVKLGRTSTPYRREKMRFLYKLEKMLTGTEHTKN